MDFNKYNKGLRYFATLFNIPASIFDCDEFLDVKTHGDFLYVIYSKLPNNEIQNILFNNPLFYNTFNDGGINFSFKLKNDTAKIEYNLMKTNGTFFCNESFIVKMCIHWKKYLDESMLDIVDVTFEDYTKEEGNRP